MHQRRLSNAWRGVFSCRSFVVVLMLVRTNVGFAADVTVETLLSDLHGPRAVAVRPDISGSPLEVFVAESGAGRIVQWNAAATDAADEVIAGLPQISRPESENAVAGIRALFFLDHNRLAAAGGQDDDTPFLWLFDLSEAADSLNAKERKQDVAMRESTADSKAVAYIAIGRTHSNDRVADLLYVVAAAEGGSDRLWKVPVHANTLSERALPVTSAAAQKLNTAGGIAVSKEGYVVVACRGSDSSTGFRTIRYLSPLDSRTVLEVPTKLQHIAALAFSPKSGNLFAAELASSNDGGGIYRIDDASEPGRPDSDAVKISPADHPTSLAFGQDGALYITVLGHSSGEESTGLLLKLTGEL